MLLNLKLNTLNILTTTNTTIISNLFPTTLPSLHLLLDTQTIIHNLLLLDPLFQLLILTLITTNVTLQLFDHLTQLLYRLLLRHVLIFY